nr:DNA binding protein [uncultured phage]CAI9752184.1 DNA binding protein [uncultured phage]
MSEIKFEKLEHIATLAETSGGYTLEVNLVSWNDKEAKVDIRRWDPQGNPKKGIPTMMMFWERFERYSR